jgi:hypothetical protein
LFEQQGGGGVACVVGSSVAKAGRLEHGLELGPVSPWVDGFAGRTRKDEIPVFPLIPGSETLCGLGSPLRLELRDQRFGDDAPADLATLRRAELPLSTLTFRAVLIGTSSPTTFRSNSKPDKFLYVFKTGPSRARKRAATEGPGERGSLRLLA